MKDGNCIYEEEKGLEKQCILRTNQTNKYVYLLQSDKRM